MQQTEVIGLIFALVNKGKPVEKRRRKATGPVKVASCDIEGIFLYLKILKLHKNRLKYRNKIYI